MAMDAATMAALVKANIDAVLPAEATACDLTYLTAFCQGIISHIQAAAVVQAGITCSVDPGTHVGATTGTGTVQ